jgi:hypothetical protein
MDPTALARSQQGWMNFAIDDSGVKIPLSEIITSGESDVYVGFVRKNPVVVIGAVTVVGLTLYLLLRTRK